MKRNCGYLLFFAGFLCLMSFYVNAQTTWSAGTKVIDQATFDVTCNANQLNSPCVIKDGSIYRMWYTREIGKSPNTFNMIAYATSTDGITWTLVDTSVIKPSGTNNVFDQDDAGQCTVIKDGDSLKMWYWGQDNNGNIGSIGYAKSIDGKNWTKISGSDDEGSVFAGPTSDSMVLLSPNIMKDGNTYKMWHSGMNLNMTTFNIIFRINYATSTNGTNWTKVNGLGKFNSIIDIGAKGKFDEAWVYFPCVLKTAIGYEMWYGGKDSVYKPNIGNSAIGYATSADGITWTRYNGTGPKGSLFLGGTPCVIKEGNTYKMWYSGLGGIYYATSTMATAINDLTLNNNTRMLSQVYPNPFSSSTLISYNLSENSFVTLKIFDLLGNEVKTLVNSSQFIGHYSVNYEGDNLKPGLYLCQLKTEKLTEIVKLMYVK